MLKQHIKNSPPKLPAIGPAKLMCLAGWEATVFVEVEVVDADICVTVGEARSVIIDEAIVIDVEMVELGDVRSSPGARRKHCTQYPARKESSRPRLPRTVYRYTLQARVHLAGHICKCKLV
jgi:hypothetical protein